MFPVEDEELKEKVIHILEVQLADNMKAHVLRPDGTYDKVDRRGKSPVNSQETFEAEAIEATKRTENYSERTFTPMYSEKEE